MQRLKHKENYLKNDRTHDNGMKNVCRELDMGVFSILSSGGITAASLDSEEQPKVRTLIYNLLRSDIANPCHTVLVNETLHVGSPQYLFCHWTDNSIAPSLSMKCYNHISYYFIIEQKTYIIAYKIICQHLVERTFCSISRHFTNMSASLK